jgi:hypothetical protein
MRRPLRDWDLRPIWIGIAVMMLVGLAVESVLLYQIVDAQDAIGDDLDYFRSVAQRWLDTGVLYSPDQLAGPYVVKTQVHNLYPPLALYLFVPFLYLPAILWWLIPLGLLAYVVWWCRPVTWALPILAALILYPKTPAVVLYGNSDIWGIGFAAAGIRWGWPAALVFFKPSVGFLALPGILTRRWWIAAAVLAVISLPLLPLWLDYPRVLLNSDTNIGRSWSNAPFFLVPFVAWLTSSRRGDIPIRTWAAKLLTGTTQPSR